MSRDDESPPGPRDRAADPLSFLDLDADLSGDASGDEDEGSEVGGLIDDEDVPMDEPGLHRRVDAARDAGSYYSDSEDEGLLAVARGGSAPSTCPPSPDVTQGEREAYEELERRSERLSRPARVVRKPKRGDKAAPTVETREAEPEEIAAWDAQVQALQGALGGNEPQARGRVGLQLSRSPFHGFSREFPVAGRPVVFDVTPGDRVPQAMTLDGFAYALPTGATREQAARAKVTRARRYLLWMIAAATQAYARVPGDAPSGTWTPPGSGGAYVPTMSLVLERLYTTARAPLEGFRVHWVAHAAGLDLDQLLDRLIERTALEYRQYQEAAASPKPPRTPFHREDDHTCFRAIRSRADMYAKVLFPLAGPGVSAELRAHVEQRLPPLHTPDLPVAPTAILTLEAACRNPELATYGVSADQRTADAYRDGVDQPTWQGEAVLADPGCVPRRIPLPAAAYNWFAAAVDPQHLRRCQLPSGEAQLRAGEDDMDDDAEIFGDDADAPPPMPAEGADEDVDLLYHIGERNRLEHLQIEEMYGAEQLVLQEELTKFRRRALTSLLEAIQRPASQPVLPEPLRAVIKYLEEVPTIWDEMPHLFASPELTSADQWLLSLMALLESNFSLRPGVLSRHLLLMLISAFAGSWGCNENRPHMLLTGLPGIGKSMLMLAVQVLLVPGTWIRLNYLSPKVLTAGSTLLRWYVYFLPEAPGYLLGIGKITNEEAFEAFKEILSDGKISSMVMELQKVVGPDGKERTIRARRQIMSDQSGVYIMATNTRIYAGREDPKERYPVLNRCLMPQPGNFRSEISALHAALEAATRGTTPGKRNFTRFMQTIHALVFLVEVAISAHAIPDVDVSLACAWEADMADYLSSIGRGIEAVRMGEQFKATCRTWTIVCAVWAATQTELNHDIRWDEDGNEVRGVRPELFEAILPMLVVTSSIIAHVTSLYEDMLLPITRTVIRRACAQQIKGAGPVKWRKTSDGQEDREYICVSDAGMDFLINRVCRASRGVVQAPGVRQELEVMGREAVQQPGETRFLVVQDQPSAAVSAANRRCISFHVSMFQGLIDLEEPQLPPLLSTTGQRAGAYLAELREIARPGVPYDLPRLIPALRTIRDWVNERAGAIAPCGIEVPNLTRRLQRLLQAAEDPARMEPGFADRFGRLLENLETIETRDREERAVAQRATIGDAFALGYASPDRPYESTTPLAETLRRWLSHALAVRQQLITTQALPMPDGQTRQSMCAIIRVEPDPGRIMVHRKRLGVNLVTEMLSVYTWGRAFEKGEASNPDIVDGPTDDVVTMRHCRLNGIQLRPHQLPSRRMEYVAYIRSRDASYADQPQLAAYPEDVIDLDNRRAAQISAILERVQAFERGDADALPDVLKNGVLRSLVGQPNALRDARDAPMPAIRRLRGGVRPGRNAYSRLPPVARIALTGRTPAELYRN